jgi:hypothetical protein
MEGDENLSMDLVIGYRGLLGGSFVALFSHLINTDRGLSRGEWWKSGLKANWPIVILTPVFMMGVRRISNYTGGKKSESDN